MYVVQQVMFTLLAPVVQTLDSAIHWINHYPLDNSIGFASVYPLHSDLSGGQRYPLFEQLGPGVQILHVNMMKQFVIFNIGIYFKTQNMVFFRKEKVTVL